MTRVCKTCGRPGSEGGVCSSGYHIEEAYAELEEAKELLGLLENGMSCAGILNGEDIEGVLMTPEYLERVRGFLKRLAENRAYIKVEEARGKEITDEWLKGLTLPVIGQNPQVHRCDNCDMQGQGCILPREDGIPKLSACFIPDTYTGGDAMIKMPGSTASFRCACGGNVFSKHQTDPLRYRCNSCKTLYEGEK